jgi:hypothetical protein
MNEYNVMLSRRRPGSRRKDDIETKHIVVTVEDAQNRDNAVRFEAAKYASDGWILAAYAPKVET